MGFFSSRKILYFCLKQKKKRNKTEGNVDEDGQKKNQKAVYVWPSLCLQSYHGTAWGHSHQKCSLFEESRDFWVCSWKAYVNGQIGVNSGRVPPHPERPLAMHFEKSKWRDILGFLEQRTGRGEQAIFDWPPRDQADASCKLPLLHWKSNRGGKRPSSLYINIYPYITVFLYTVKCWEKEKKLLQQTDAWYKMKEMR